MTSQNPDPVQALAEAVAQRQAIADSLGQLRADAQHFTTMYQEAHDVRERHEGDALVGTVSAAKLAKSREKCEAAQQSVRRSGATLRQAEERLVQLDADIVRLTPEVLAAEITGFTATHEDLARQLADALTAAEAINERLHENFRAAEVRFPGFVRRNATIPPAYPVAAGCPDLSWHELRTNPYATNGGKLGTWRRKFEEFLRRGEPVQAPPVPRPCMNPHPVMDAREGRNRGTGYKGSDGYTGSGLDTVSAEVARLNSGGK